MNQISTSLIKIGIVIVVLCFLQSCKYEICDSQIEKELVKTDILAQKKPFTLKNDSNGWVVSKEDEQVIESRYSYKIEIDPESDLILLNHRKLRLNNVSEGLEKEFLELVKLFENEEVSNFPNVGFQIIYPIDSKKINMYKISETICTISKSVKNLKKKSKANLDIGQDKILKLLQSRFSFFPATASL